MDGYGLRTLQGYRSFTMWGIKYDEFVSCMFVCVCAYVAARATHLLIQRMNILYHILYTSIIVESCRVFLVHYF